MKKLLTLLLTALAILVVSETAIAQINTPAPSPKIKMEQTVGLTTVTLEYSRPSVKGRNLFVDVEEFGKIWRTGANQATKITFSDDVKLEGKSVPAGTYALYSIPDPTNWTIMLYKDTKLGGNTSKYDKTKEQARFKVKGYKRSSFVESFFIDISDLKDGGATMALKWGNYYVPFKLEVSYDDAVMKQIETAMAGTSRGEYYSAASYYYKAGKDMNKAYDWVKKANEIDQKFWQLRLQARIEAKLGKYKQAITTAGISSALAKKAGNMGYVKMNDKDIKEWKDMM